MSTTIANDTLYNAGHWLIAQDRHEDAKHVFRTMLALAPSDERAWLALGACHEGTHELEKAARLYALAPLACGDSLRCLIAHARVLRRLEREDAAASAYALAADLATQVDDSDLAALIAAEQGGE